MTPLSPEGPRRTQAESLDKPRDGGIHKTRSAKKVTKNDERDRDLADAGRGTHIVERASTVEARSVNSTAFMLAERAFGSGVANKIGSTEDLIRYVVTDVFRVPEAAQPSDGAVTALAHDLVKALHLFERCSTLDQVAATEQMIKLLLKDSGEKARHAKTLRSKIRGLEQKPGNEAKIEELTAKLCQTETHGARGLSWRNLGALFQHLGRAAVANGSLADAKGIEGALNQGVGFALEKLVSQRLGIDVPSASIRGALEKYSHIFQAITQQGALSKRARERFEKTNPERMWAPMLEGIDRSDIPRTAREIVSALRFNVGSKEPELIASLEKILATAETNLDLIAACTQEVKTRTGLRDEQLGIHEVIDLVSALKNNATQTADIRTGLDEVRRRITVVKQAIAGGESHRIPERDALFEHRRVYEDVIGRSERMKFALGEKTHQASIQLIRLLAAAHYAPEELKEHLTKEAAK